MSSINELLDSAKTVTGSDYKTAQRLGITRQRLYAWRTGDQNAQPEDHALVAAIAGADPEEALVRAVLAKHADTPKGERLLTALGKGLRVTGAVVTSLFFASVGFLVPAREAHAQMKPSHDNV